MSDVFCLRLPLRFPENYEVSGLDRPFSARMLGFPVELERDGSYHVITVKNISCETEALSLLSRLRVGVHWAGLDLRTGIMIFWPAQAVKYFSNPEKAAKRMMLQDPVDAVIDSARPAIYLDRKNVRRLTAHGVNALHSIRPMRFLDALESGLKRAMPGLFDEKGQLGRRLQSAIDFYALSYFEPNVTTRLLLQCTALEVLAPSSENESSHILRRVDQWTAQLEVEINTLQSDSRERDDLIRFERRVRQLRKSSHSQRLLKFARDMLDRIGADHVDDKAKRIMNAYHTRSRFLHEGSTTNIGDAATTLHDLLPELLKAVLEAPDSGSNTD